MLPTCPACKQSVLDDDATECPFCGANMKTGKAGGAKPAAPSKAASKSTPASSAASSSKPAASAAKSTAGASRKSIVDDDDDDPFSEKDDDDPFAAATKEAAASKANAIPVSPKKTKTHVVELKCPMCDTVGFVPEKSGGKDVKCCNPKCSVPVFMAPKNLALPAPIVAAKPVAAPKGPSKKPLIFAIAGGVALVAVVGGIAYFWDTIFAKPDPKGISFEDEVKRLKAEREAQGLPPVITGDPTTPVLKEGDPKAKANDVAVVEVQQLDIPLLLQLMEERSLDEKLVNKKYCRQRTAIAYALAGNVEGMKSQFQSLDQVEANLQHFKIPAYLTLGWSQLARGDKKGAAQTADDAVAATVNVGKGSRDTQEAIIDLTAFLVATGKADAGKKVLADHLKADASTPLVVATSLARHRRDYDLDQEIPGRTSNPSRAWPEVGVTLILASEGFWAEALQWADTLPAVEPKTDCLVAWADAKLRDAIAKKQPVDSTVEAVAEKLTPGGKVQLLARLGLTQATAGNNSDAERLVSAAQGALKAIPVPEAARSNDFKQVLEWKVPDAVPLRQATVGAATLGAAQAQLKKLDEGFLSVLEGLKYARGMAPTPPAVAAQKAAVEELGLEALRDKIRMLLSLRARDEAVRKARELQNKLDQLEELASSRFHLQEAILQDAVNSGMTKLVWDEALNLSQRNDINELEPYLSGTLPAHLLQRFNHDGMTAEAGQVASNIEEGQLPIDEAFELQKIVEASLKANNFADAITAFNQQKLTGKTEEVALRGIIQAAKHAGQAVPILTLADTMETKTHNQFVKLEALRMLAAYASLHGESAKVQTIVQGQKLSSLEKICGYLGLIEGDLARKHAQAAATVAPDKSESAKKADTK